MEPPPVGPNDRIRVSPSVYTRAFGAELVLLHFGRGDYFALDEIGAEIFRRLEAGASIAAVAEAIEQLYEVSRDVALGDIVTLVGEMRDRNLLTVG